MSVFQLEIQALEAIDQEQLDALRAYRVAANEVAAAFTEEAEADGPYARCYREIRNRASGAATYADTLVCRSLGMLSERDRKWLRMDSGTSLIDADIPVQLASALFSGNVMNLEEAAELSREELLALKGIGPRYADLIEQAS